MNAILTEKSVLIVARKLEELSQLRSIYASLGSTDISVASSANMAMSMLRMRPFDFCVIQASLGEHEKSGMQVIEEAAREGLRQATSAFILVVDEELKELPRDSLNCGPDTFISKPVEGPRLIQRMEKLVKLKQAVRPVEALLDDGELEKALQLIPRLVARYASLELYLDRIKGRVLLDLERYQEAVEHCSRVAQDRDVDWAYLGWGVAEFHLGHYIEAMRQFNTVLERNSRSLEAYEWLSQVYRGAGKNRQAQALLEKASVLLPTAPTIQSGLGNVATENSNWDVATDAFRNAVRYAKHSLHQSQDNYFGLARCLQTRLSPNGGAASASAQEEAVRILENVVEEYFDNDHIRFRSRLMTAETYKYSGDMTRANAAAKDAFAVYKSLPDNRKAEELDNLLEGVEGTSIQETVETFRNDFNQKVCAETEWGRYNLEGMGLYRKGQFYDAFCRFSKALEQIENSPSIMLNLVQAGHEVIKQQPEKTPEVLATCHEKLRRMSIGALNTKQQARYRALSEHRSRLLGELQDN